jgi:hypothetical protein
MMWLNVVALLTICILLLVYNRIDNKLLYNIHAPHIQRYTPNDYNPVTQRLNLEYY